MSDREEKPRRFPPCRWRKRVNGMFMCYAIGCCEIGDMACNCYDCDKHCDKMQKARKAK